MGARRGGGAPVGDVRLRALRFPCSSPLTDRDVGVARGSSGGAGLGRLGGLRGLCSGGSLDAGLGALCSGLAQGLVIAAATGHNEGAGDETKHNLGVGIRSRGIRICTVCAHAKTHQGSGSAVAVEIGILNMTSFFRSGLPANQFGRTRLLP